MRPDHAAQLDAVEMIHMPLPQTAAVSDIILKELIGLPREPQKYRHRIVYTVPANLFNQEIVGFSGSSRLAQDRDFAVFDRDDRLDVQHFSRHRSGARDPAALSQILERIDHCDQPDLLSLLSKMPDQLVELHALFRAAAGVLRQHAGAYGDALAVHDAHIRILLRRQARALISARYARGDRDHHGAVPLLLKLLKHFLKSFRAWLAGSRQLFALLQPLVEFVLAQRHSVRKYLFAKRYRQRHYRI